MTATRAITLIFILTLAASQSSAAKIAVIVDYPDGTTHTECVQLDEGASGYELINKLHASSTWGGPHPLYGHSLCMIGTTGTAPSGEGCEWGTQSWALWTVMNGSSAWQTVPVGYDGGETCWNRDPYSWEGHYCATGGDVIGLTYGSYNPATWAAPQMRTTSSYEALCPLESSGGGALRKPKLLGMAVLPLNPAVGEDVSVQLWDNATGRPVKGARVGVYQGQVAVTAPVEETESDAAGQAWLAFDKPGEYIITVTGTQYPHERLLLNVLAASTEEPTTTTEEETTATVQEDEPLEEAATEETTTTEAPAPSTTASSTTTQSTTTTLRENVNPVTGMASAQKAEHEDTLFQRLLAWLGLL